MTETYSAKPWINLDQIDKEGTRAEVQVISGVGKVDELEETKSGKAYKVVFGVDNTEWGISGHVAKEEEKVVKAIQEALNSSTPIGFRIEKSRQPHVDRKLPMDEISPPGDTKAARENTFRSLVAVQPEGEEWEITRNMRTRFEEDPQTGSSQGGAYDVDLDTFTGGSAGATATAPLVKNNNEVEAPPFVNHNNDGSVNMGAIAVGVPVNLLFFVEEYCRDNNVNLSEEERKKVAEMIFKISNTMQRRIYKSKQGVNLKKPLLSAGSHTRARQIAMGLIEGAYPITEDLTTDEAFKEWGVNIIGKGLNIWEWSYDTSEKFL